MVVTEELLKEELIVINMKAKNSDESINKLAKILYEKGFVKESYIQGILEREKNFPTGLPTEGVGVAIPHTDAEHVNNPAIAIAVLEKPVAFKMMGGAIEQEVEVQILFMLAIKESKTQIELLQKLMNIFQDKKILESIQKSLTPAEIKDNFSVVTKDILV